MGRFLIISGGLWAVTLAFPVIVFIGFIALIVPGALMMLAGPAFVYVGLGALAFQLSSGMAPPLRMAVTLGLPLLVAFALPALLDEPERRLTAAIRAQDVPPPPEGLPGFRSITIAINRGTELRADSPGWMQDIQQNTLRCDELCIRLLYNGGAERVVMAALSRGRLGEESRIVASRGYRIERGADCPAVDIAHLGQGSWGDLRHPDNLAARVRMRIAAGECLVSAETGATDAILSDMTDTPRNARNAHRQAAIAETWGARRIELRSTSASGDAVLFRETETSRQRLWPVLMVGPVFEGMRIESGFWRAETVQDRIVDSQVFRRIFGDKAQPPLAVADDGSLARRLTAALADPSTSPATLQQRADGFLQSLIQKRSVDAADTALIVRLLDDDRYRDIHFFYYEAMRVLRPRLDDLAGALVRRATRQVPHVPETQRVQFAFWGRLIGELSPAALASIAPQLIDHVDRDKGVTLIDSLVARYGELGPRGIARLRWHLREHRAWGREEMAGGDSNSLLGAVIAGICRSRAFTGADAPVLLGLIKNHAAEQQPKNQAFIRAPQRAAAVALIRSGQAGLLQALPIHDRYRTALMQAVSDHDQTARTGFMRPDACNA